MTYLSHHHAELALIRQCSLGRAWRTRRDAGAISPAFWWEKKHGPKRIVPHPEGHRNRSVLFHQHRRSSSGATIVRGGVLKMPPLRKALTNKKKDSKK